MTFAGRVVVMNGGRIEQIGRPRAKREPSPNQSVSLMVPRGGLKQLRPFNYLSCPTLRSCPIAFQGVFLTLSHRILRLPSEEPNLPNKLAKRSPPDQIGVSDEPTRSL